MMEPFSAPNDWFVYGHLHFILALPTLTLISLYPQGLDDKASKECGTGWDVGPSGHDAATCNAGAYSSTCCYSSCLTTGACDGDRGTDGTTDTGLTEHSGCPVKKGEKWVATQWMREGVNTRETWMLFDPQGGRL